MNPVDLMKILPGALKLLAPKLGFASKAAEEVAQVLDRNKDNPEMQMALAGLEVEKLKIDASVTIAGEETDRAMIASDDVYTKRARPTSTYAAIVFTGALVVAEICRVPLDTGLVLSLIGPLWGHAGFYSYHRTREKLGRRV